MRGQTLSCRDTTENPPNSGGCFTTARPTRSFLPPQKKGNQPIKLTQHTTRHWEQRHHIPTTGVSQAHTPAKRQLPQAPRTQTISTAVILRRQFSSLKPEEPIKTPNTLTQADDYCNAAEHHPTPNSQPQNFTFSQIQLEARALFKKALGCKSTSDSSIRRNDNKRVVRILRDNGQGNRGLWKGKPVDGMVNTDATSYNLSIKDVQHRR